MKDSVFRFKRFSVHNEHSGLKVGTDGVLLGSSCTLPCAPACLDDRGDAEGKSLDVRILDVGTGTGLIALMIAQRAEFLPVRSLEITGVEIDGDAAEEAALNFSQSPWADRLRAVNTALQNFEDGCWDFIVSNPPFFENSLRAPQLSRSNARHTDALSYREIIAFASRSLNERGIVSMILPASEETSLLRYAASFGLHAFRILSIRTTAAKAPKRIVVELCRRRAERICGASAGNAQAAAQQPLREELVMMSDGVYTPAFRALTGEFYLDASSK